MDNFYESLLYLKYYDKEKVLKEINKIITEELDDVMEYASDLEGLCKVLSNNVKCRLDELNIQNKKVNIKEIGSNIEHEFVLGMFKDKSKNTNYILIDPTYRQFVKKYEILNKLNEWPATLLEQSNNELLNNLLNSGCSEIDSNSFNNYINSFGIDYSLDDILLEKYKGDEYEADIKNNKK